MLAALLTAFALAQAGAPDASAALRAVLAEAQRVHGFPAAAVRVARRGRTLGAAVVGARVAAANRLARAIFARFRESGPPPGGG